MELIELLSSPYCRLHLDCIAMSTESTSIPDLLRRHREVLAHVHANDFSEQQGPGFGELDFPPDLHGESARSTIRAGFRSRSSTLPPAPSGLARESIEYMRAVLAHLAATQ